MFSYRRYCLIPISKIWHVSCASWDSFSCWMSSCSSWIVVCISRMPQRKKTGRLIIVSSSSSHFSMSALRVSKAHNLSPAFMHSLKQAYSTSWRCMVSPALAMAPILWQPSSWSYVSRDALNIRYGVNMLSSWEKGIKLCNDSYTACTSPCLIAQRISLLANFPWLCMSSALNKGVRARWHNIWTALYCSSENKDSTAFQINWICQ